MATNKMKNGLGRKEYTERKEEKCRKGNRKRRAYFGRRGVNE